MLLAFLIAACQESAGTEATRIPTRIPPTPTIRSTPLPDVSPAPALGKGEERQIVIQIALFGEDASDDSRRAANQLRQMLQDELELEIGVEFVNETDALKALCSGAPHAAWINPFTYVQAQTECDAEPVLAITRGRSPRTTVGRTAEIIARQDITEVSQIQGRVFCRSYEEDYFTNWVFPSLYLAAAGVNPISGLDQIKDYPDNLSLGRALYVGDCAAASLPPDEFEDWLIDLSAFLSTDREPVTGRELADVLRVVQPAADVSFKSGATRLQYARGVIPYEVLVFPPDSAIPAALREDITDVIVEFFEARDTGDQRLNDLLDATGVVPVAANSYQNFASAVVDAKWDMALTD